MKGVGLYSYYMNGEEPYSYYTYERSRTILKGEGPYQYYMRNCRRCGKVYKTPAKHGRICTNCEKPKFGR